MYCWRHHTGLYDHGNSAVRGLSSGWDRLRRVVPLCGGTAFIVGGLVGIIRGQSLLFSSLSIAFGFLAVGSLLYNDIEPTIAKNKELLTMSVVWLLVGASTLLAGVVRGGVLVPISALGFAFSMYLSVSMLLAAIRDP